MRVCHSATRPWTATEAITAALSSGLSVTQRPPEPGYDQPEPGRESAWEFCSVSSDGSRVWSRARSPGCSRATSSRSRSPPQLRARGPRQASRSSEPGGCSYPTTTSSSSAAPTTSGSPRTPSSSGVELADDGRRRPRPSSSWSFVGDGRASTLEEQVDARRHRCLPGPQRGRGRRRTPGQRGRHGRDPADDARRRRRAARTSTGGHPRLTVSTGRVGQVDARAGRARCSPRAPSSAAATTPTCGCPTPASRGTTPRSSCATATSGSRTSARPTAPRSTARGSPHRSR